MRTDYLYQIRFILLVIDVTTLSYLSWYFFFKEKETVSKYFSGFLLGRAIDSLGILVSMIFYYQPIPLWLNIKRVTEVGIKVVLTSLFALYIFGLVGNIKNSKNKTV